MCRRRVLADKPEAGAGEGRGRAALLLRARLGPQDRGVHAPRPAQPW